MGLDEAFSRIRWFDFFLDQLHVMLNQLDVPQLSDIFFFELLDSVINQFVRDQDGERHYEVRKARVSFDWINQFPEEFEDKNRAKTHEIYDVISHNFKDHVFVNLDANIKTAAYCVEFADFRILHGYGVSYNEKIQIKFPLLICRNQTKSEVENGEVPDSAVEDWTVNVKMVVTKEKCEDKADGEEGVRNVSGWLNLEMAVNVKCEEEKGRRVDFFSKEHDEMFLNFLFNVRALHIEFSNYYLEITPAKMTSEMI
jgi:hypothetical protein